MTLAHSARREADTARASRVTAHLGRARWRGALIEAVGAVLGAAHGRVRVVRLAALADLAHTVAAQAGGAQLQCREWG